MTFTRQTRDILRAWGEPEYFASAAQRIFENTYLKPFDASKSKVDLYALPVERISHGSQHASRVAAYIPILLNFFKQLGYPKEVLSVTAEEITLLQYAALFHDTARKNDKIDISEKESAALFKQYLIDNGINDQVALNFSDYITREKKDFLNQLLETADSLDIMRNKPALILEMIPLFSAMASEDAQHKFIELAIAIRQLIAEQHDLGYDCEIKLNGQVKVPALKATRDASKAHLKQSYEQAKNCCQKTLKDIMSHRELRDLYLGHVLSGSSRAEEKHISNSSQNIFSNAQMHLSSNKKKYIIRFATQEAATQALIFAGQQWETVKPKTVGGSVGSDSQTKIAFPYAFRLTPWQWEELRRKLRAPIASLQEDYIIKSIRADEFCFYSKFVEMVTEGKKHPLRKGNKKRITVTGKGIHLRSGTAQITDDEKALPLKKPQYTPEQKKLGGRMVSKFQSASLGTPTHSPLVFGCNKSRKEALAGIFLPTKGNVLFSHRNYIYDGGTVDRPYDFDSLIEARKYFDRVKGKILFSADEIEEFKKAITHPNNANNYNEVMVRMLWSITHGKIFAASDTLESRLQAQEYARVMKQALLKLKLVNENYVIPLFFYAPDNPSIHFKEYTEIEQKMDILDAEIIFFDIKLKEGKYINKYYQFLLALPPDKIKIVLQEKVKKSNLITTLFDEGYIYILESLADKLHISLEELYLQYLKEKVIDSDTKNQNGHTPIMFAAQKGYLSVVQHLASEEKGRLEQPYENGSIAIHFAADGGYLPVIKYLVEECHASLNQPNKEGQTPLWFAADNGHLEAVQYLIDQGAVPNQQDKATLITLAEKDRDLYLTWLKKKIIDPDTENKNGLTPIMFAARKGYLNVVQHLASEEKGRLEQPYENGSIAIHFAAQGGYLPVIKYLVEECHISLNQPNGQGHTPLWFAAVNGHLEAVQYLIDQGAVPNQQDKATLITLAEKDRDLYLTWLKKKIIDPDTKNKNGHTPIMFAARKGYLNVVQHLASEEKGTLEQPYKNGSIAIHFAAQGGYLPVIKYLVEECHASLNQPNKEGQTPLWFAADDGHLEAVQYLIDQGAVPNQQDKATLITLAEKDRDLYLTWLKKKIIDPDTKNKRGLTPIMVTAFNGYLDSVRHLAEDKGILDQTDANGNGAIHSATQGGHLPVMKYLVEECHVSLNQPNKNDETALMIAVYSEKLDILSYLIEKGAAINQANKSGQTALSWALKSNKFNIVDTLLIAGVDVTSDNVQQTSNPVQDKLKTFMNMPKSDQKEEKSTREEYLRDVRKRMIDAYQEQDIKQPKINQLKQEIHEFNQLETWIRKLKLAMTATSDQKNPNLTYAISLVYDVIATAYAVFQHTKSVNHAINYLKTNCAKIVEDSAIFSITYSSAFSFFKKQSLKDYLEHIFFNMEKKHPAPVQTTLAKNDETRNTNS